VASENGWKFHDDLGDKLLRDRIRCFYKTHLQNARKRLATLQRHPESPDSQRVLRVYVRSVREGMSFEQSRQLEDELTNSSSGRLDRRAGSLDRSVDPRGEILTDLKKAHATHSKLDGGCDAAEKPCAAAVAPPAGAENGAL
jgi:hypothetical protein